MNRPAVISFCDRTGIMVKPWANAGCECWCVDTQHSIRRDRDEVVGEGLIHYVWGDVRSWRLPDEARGRVVIGFGFPPCTHLTVSDARDFKKKSGWMLAESLQLFDSIEVAFSFGGFAYMIENPIGRLNSHRREPDFSFQPWYFGDLWTKNTCLWTGNGFIMPTAKYTSPPEGVTNKIFEMTPSDDRADLRSETPPCFAEAVFKSNAPRLLTQPIDGEKI